METKEGSGQALTFGAEDCHAIVLDSAQSSEQNVRTENYLSGDAFLKALLMGPVASQCR